MKSMQINGKTVQFDQEKNMLEVIRNAGIELPTFCYYSELSIYGACRLCLVEDRKGNIIASCSEPPKDGAEILTHTLRLQKQRRNTMELLLANHDRDCTTCGKSGACKLQELTKALGVDSVRFGKHDIRLPLDTSSASLVRNPNKCILCGDCVRVCEEIQGIGVIGFAYRGSKARVTPPFDKNLSDVACISCGLCVSHCPTAALEVRSETDHVWRALYDDTKTVVAQVAPALRVSFGEAFGLKPGTISTGKIVGALKALGFKMVFDTSFCSDLTVVEESAELNKRIADNESLPLFTSCCPAWVKFAELKYPKYLKNLSTCRSPQQMLGSLVKERFKQAGEKQVYMVSVMPCTAKKEEAKNPKFAANGVADVDSVITAIELASMIKSAGIIFEELEELPFDMPFGFATGAGTIFGVTGGVTEAVLRGLKPGKSVYKEVRGLQGLKEYSTEAGGRVIKAAIVSGIQNAKNLIAKIESGQATYDIVEVMACPGGCVNGAGLSASPHSAKTRLRSEGLYKEDAQMQFVRSPENPVIEKLYADLLGSPGSHKAHDLLHTHYSSRKRIHAMELGFEEKPPEKAEEIKVCVGTCCYTKGSYDLFQEFFKEIAERNLGERVSLQATFCLERCQESPNIKVGDKILGGVNRTDVAGILSGLTPKE
ncbi:MAG: NADP-reducing hydrogenase subunit HndC [Syntrophomonadaceae bacterium]|nr:NADP-reducing hydrogenase subunit HndC [Bacillota bacterium]